MPLTNAQNKLRRLSVAIGCLCAHGAYAQELPRRSNLESAWPTDAQHRVALDRHVIEVPAQGAAFVPADAGGPLVDLQTPGPAPPALWSSEGGALFVEQRGQPTGAGRWLYDTGATGRRWIMLRGRGSEAAVIAHVRDDGERGGEDPWQVPLRPSGEPADRYRPGRRDAVTRLGRDEPASYAVDGVRTVRLEVSRPQVPRLLPPDATWLRVEADGRVIFDGRVPTPVVRERPYVVDGCAQVLDLAGRVRIDLPEGARELRISGEPGTWLKVLAPLPGTPRDALAVGVPDERDRLALQADEALATTFNRAVSLYPDPRAQAFLGRYSYYRDVAIIPTGGATLATRSWRMRSPDRELRREPATNRTANGDATISATTFHWLPAGGGWRLDLPREPRLGLVRISVAHPARPAAGVHLRLSGAGGIDQELRLEPEVIEVLGRASAAADALLAIDPIGEPIVDASQAVLRITELGEPANLVNVGTQGAWIAVEQRVPAPRRLAEAAIGSAAISPQRLRSALLGHDDPALAAAARPGDLGATRAIERARALLDARARGFANDPCVASAASAPPPTAVRALSVLERVRNEDPLLARCAVLQAAASAPRDPDVMEVLDRWATEADRADLRTGFVAWAMRDVEIRSDASAWLRLAEALEAEDESEAAALARRAAGVPGEAAVAASDRPGPALQPAQSDGVVRLGTERDTEIAFALVSGHVAAWPLPHAGDYELELRSFASTPDLQWVLLRSGDDAWMTALRPADEGRAGLRDVATGFAPGAAVRVPLQASAPGGVLRVDPGKAPVLARVVPKSPQKRRELADGRDLKASGELRAQPVEVQVAANCRVRPLDTSLAVVLPAPPGTPGAPLLPGADIVPAADAPVIGLPVDGPTRDGQGESAVSAALRALWWFDHGDRDAAAVAAARALHLRDQQPAVAATSAAFAMLESRLSWKRVEPVRSAGRRLRQIADGHSTNPLVAQRQRFAGADDEDRFVLRPDQGWVLEGLQPRQRVRLTLQRRSVLPAGRVEVRLTDGSEHVLEGSGAQTVEDVADARGELHLRVGDALPGTFVTMQVATAANDVLDPRRGLVYHRAPVTVHLDRPGFLRIVEWNGEDSVVRTQWVPEAGDVVLRPLKLQGAALRVSRMVVDPAPSGPETPAADPIAGDADRLSPSEPLPAVSYVPAAGQASTWPERWPDSGGEDGTWGFFAGLRERLDADDPLSDRERFSELGWRYRYRLDHPRVWGRLGITGRRHVEGYGVAGIEHTLQWRQADGPWGASLETDAWRQDVPAAIGSSAHSVNVRAAVEWEQRRHERWHDEWQLGLRWRELSLGSVPRRFRSQLDNDVYTRYRDEHRDQLDLAYTLRWRARYDTEWVASARAVSNPLADFGLDQAGVNLRWRWARHGWTASAEFDARRYFRDDHRDRAFQRERIEFNLGRLFMGFDHGWRVRASAGYDLGARGAYGGVIVEWFDHDGRGLRDFGPSELYLRTVTETDLYQRLLPPDDLP